MVSKSVTRPVSGSRIHRTLAYFTAERESAMQLMPAMPKAISRRTVESWRAIWLFS